MFKVKPSTCVECYINRPGSLATCFNVCEIIDTSQYRALALVIKHDMASILAASTSVSVAS